MSLILAIPPLLVPMGAEQVCGHGEQGPASAQVENLIKTKAAHN